MDDEQKQIRKVERGRKAKATLENESILNAFAYLDAEYTRLWKDCADAEGRDRLWQATKVLEKVKEHLALAARDGRVSEKILESIANERRIAA